ncbi:MAG TPA: M23 family metallopeptidase [Thermoanaerobaculia bacterium]|nr:M23 family metallopeptidase [Thermoanaerobaculia bacterium]
MELARLFSGWSLRKAFSAPRESWNLEVQIHPSDIRKRVRYLFLSRVQVTVWSVVLLAYLLFLAFAVAVAPGVVGGVLNGQEYQALVTERASQGRRLQLLVNRMSQLEERGQALNLRMRKISIAYGLPQAQARGRGGYPFLTPPAPGSIYSGTIEQGDRIRSRIGQELAVLDAFLREILEFEKNNREQVRTTPALCPLSGMDFVLTSPFGRRRSPFTKEFELHTGLDLAAPRGTPVHATAEGVVTFAGVYPMRGSPVLWRYGNLVIVRNGDRFVTIFGHLDEIKVKARQKVKPGEIVGTVGNTGWSTNPQVHYEVRRAGGDGEYRPADPILYILDRRWQNEERLLVRAQNGPEAMDYEPLPKSVIR